jgi:hypothetical protein
MTNSNYNSKRMSTLRQDTLMNKSMNMGLKRAKYENIVRVRTLHVPLIFLKESLSVISKQNKLWVSFTNVGMITSPQEHQELVRLLLISVKYN